mgnify:CR=1 FL=1
MIKLRINLTNIPLLTSGNLRGIPPGAGFVKRPFSGHTVSKQIGNTIKVKEPFHISYFLKTEKDTDLENEIKKYERKEKIVR